MEFEVVGVWWWWAGDVQENEDGLVGHDDSCWSRGLDESCSCFGLFLGDGEMRVGICELVSGVIG